MTIFAVGHSNLPIGEFIAVVQAHGVSTIVDVRSIPRSRSNPQFNSEILAATLAGVAIGYRHIAALGGLRHHRKGDAPSINTLWRNASFRNYADYACTTSFRGGLDELLHIASSACCAVMCAEVLWWRCHRRIIADYLLTASVETVHIIGCDKLEPAVPTNGACPQPDGTVLYPARSIVDLAPAST